MRLNLKFSRCLGTCKSKICVMVWKNFLLQWRRPVQTLFQVLVPVAFSLVFILIRELIAVNYHPEGRIFEPFEPPFDGKGFILMHCPTNPVIDKIMNETTEVLEMKPFALSTCKDLNSIHHKWNLSEFIFAVVAFEDKLANVDSLPVQINITIRFPATLRTTGRIQDDLIFRTWQTVRLYPHEVYPGPRNTDYLFGGPPGYGPEGFLTLQKQLGFSLIKYYKEKNNGSSSFSSQKILMRRFSYPGWLDDPFVRTLEKIGAILFILGFTYTFMISVKTIVAEKELQLKEIMSMMGLPKRIYWLSWFISMLTLYVVSILLMTIILKASWFSNKPSSFNYANPTILFIFLLLFSCATITFTFLVTKFFETANNASAAAGMIWVLSFIPWPAIDVEYAHINWVIKLCPCLLSNTALGLGLKQIVNFESNQIGIQWHNIWQKSSPEDSIVFGYVILLLIFDTFLYMGIVILLENNFLKERIKNVYDIVLKKIPKVIHEIKWKNEVLSIEMSHQKNSPINNNYNNNDETTISAEVISLHTITKIFNQKVAVDNLSMSVIKDQVTVLLGHNGAGKTTLLSIITRFISPDSGTATFKGKDILSFNSTLTLGYCPQFNTLLNDLTVYENMYIFCRIKGLEDRKVIKEEIDVYLNMLELKEKKHSIVSTLSGGMKRKLCVGIALCGNSELVILDEPSAGMDPKARRALWKVVISQKKSRFIILTTHSMDEADIVGDKIGIMLNGRLHCIDTSFTLKKKYGLGYVLVIDLLPSANTENITHMLKESMPKIELVNSYGSQLKYRVSESNTEHLPRLLKSLEDESKNLEIRGFGISVTTLGDVFSHVLESAMPDAEDTTSPPVLQQQSRTESIQSQSIEEHVKGCALFLSQFMAIFLKRVLLFYRSLFLFFVQIAMVVIFTIIAIYIGRAAGNISNPKLPISLRTYSHPVTTVTTTNNNSYYDYYKKLVTKSSKLEDWRDGNFLNKIWNKTKEETQNVRRNYIVGASFADDVTAWFNNIPLHSAPLSLSLVLNAILQSEVDDSHLISFFTHPIVMSAKTKVNTILHSKSVGAELSFYYGFIMAFITSFFIIFYVYERQRSFKHLQYISGVNMFIYWFAAFLWDVIVFSLIIAAIVLTLMCFQEDGFNSTEDFIRLSSIFTLFSVTCFSITYVLSFLFDYSATGFVWLTVFNLFTGITPYVIIQVLKDELIGLLDTADLINNVFMFFPHYALTTSIGNVYQIRAVKIVCDEKIKDCIEQALSDKCSKLVCDYSDVCCDVSTNYWEWEEPGIGKIMFYQSIVGVCFFIILCIIELDIFKYVFLNCFSKSPTNLVLEDDVETEKERVNEIVAKNKLQYYPLVLKDITKKYKKKVAVNKLDLVLQPFECFGLLGQNGAGKTSLLKMITGDTSITYGNAWVEGFRIKSEINQVRKRIGYCPQFDAVMGDLTGRETLIVFGLIKGIKLRSIGSVIYKTAKLFNFEQYLNVKVRYYSGGNRRKLSTAIAFLGNVSLVYLDEPSTGLDPISQRQIWDILHVIREIGTSIIITTHLMEECEALCTRVAIMANGNFKCIGSVQYLKEKFMGGYILTLKIVEDPSERQKIENFIKDNFITAVLAEHFKGFLSYTISTLPMPLSKMFAILEEAKQRASIEDYSLGQAGLEQVFLSFAKTR